jgi:glycosyltransferase involved in cell wall biosynthesis
VVEPGDLPPEPARTPLRVLHVLTKFEDGAGGNTLVSATGMDPARYEVWIVGSEGGPLWELAERAGIRTVPLANLHRELSPLADLRALARLVRIIRGGRFTVVHAHNAKGGFLGRLAAWLCGTPVVVYTLHGRDPWWRTSDSGERLLGEDMSRSQRLMYLAMERALRPVTDAFVAVAPRVARDAVESGIAPAGKVRVAPSALDLDAVPYAPDPTARLDLGIPADTPLVGTVGRLGAQKAPLDFVRMARIVARARPDARFVWVGRGPLMEAARAEAQRLGVEVTFTGYRPDAARIASTFDVYVVSSLYEGVGRSLTEALASGRPVVATAVDGVADVVVHGATGLLASARDPSGLAERVTWMLDHPAAAQRMGRQGRGFVRSLFAQSELCGRLDRLYSDLLGLPPASAGTQLARESPAGPNGSGRSRHPLPFPSPSLHG